MGRPKKEVLAPRKKPVKKPRLKPIDAKPSGLGRPKKIVDEESILDLARIMCTNEEICDILHIDEKTLINRFSSVLKEGRATGRKSVRRQQYDLLAAGNATMGVWLGKVYCGQKEEVHVMNTEVPALDIPVGAINQRKKQDG